MTRCPPATAPGATVPRGVPPVHPEEDRAIRLAAQAIWPARVRALLEADPGAVERVARAIVGDRAATLADWSVGLLPGGGGDNPASGGSTASPAPSSRAAPPRSAPGCPGRPC